MLEFFTSFPAEFTQNFITDSRYLIILRGLGTTLKISLLAICLGIILGLVVTFLRRSRFKPLRAIGYLYVDIIRGTPMVTQLTIIYFIIFGPLHVNPLIAGFIAFGINSGAYISEIFRAGLQSVDAGQLEAGRSLGLSSGQTMRYIVLPQAVKNVLPALGNEFITLIKETAIISIIGVQDLQMAADIIKSRTYDVAISLIAVGIIYYTIIKLLTLALAAFERRLNRSNAQPIKKEKRNGR